MTNVRIDIQIRLKLCSDRAIVPQAFLKKLYSFASLSMEACGYSEELFLSECSSLLNSKERQTAWQSIKRASAFKMAFAGVENEWRNTDFVFDIRIDRFVFGIEFGIKDPNHEVTCREIISQLASSLEGVGEMLQLLMPAMTKRPVISVSTCVFQDGSTETDRGWAQSVFDELYRCSQRPTFQAYSRKSKLRFAKRIYPPLDGQGLPIDWSMVFPSDQCHVWSHGGPRCFEVCKNESTRLHIQHVFWAQQGTPHGKFLKSGRPYIPRNHVDILDNCFLTYEGTLTRDKMHKSMALLLKRVQRHHASALQQIEADLSNCRMLAENLRRYRLNTVDAMLGLGLINRRTEGNDLLDYFDATIAQVEIEEDRFAPEFDRAEAEMERAGGILGWPGFVFATGALVLASLDTWWGVVGTSFSTDFKNDSDFARLSLVVIAICPLVAGLVLLSVGLGKFLRTWRRDRLSGGSFFGAALKSLSSPSFVFIALACAASCLLSLKVFHASELISGKDAWSEFQQWVGPFREWVFQLLGVH